MRHRGIHLSGKKAVITGASSGIGRELALALAQRGATLALAARRKDLLDDLADEISGMGVPRPAVLPVDLAIPGSAAELGRRAMDALGTVDIVVNNAGANLTGAQPLVADSAAARAVFEVNVWSPLALTSALLPAMRAANSGVIVNVTSTVQAVPLPLLGYYSASKAALAQATKSLRLELAGTGIRVLEVVPGATDTALRDIDELPWKTTPPPTLPPVAPASTAAAIVRGLERGARRVIHPRYSLLPLEVPVLGRVLATVGGRRVDTRGALAGPIR